MGMKIGNMGSMGTVCGIGGRHGGRQVTVLKNADGTEAGRITRTGGNSGNSGKKLKKLQYNFKQISARILQAKTSGNAGQTVIMARSKLAALRQKAKGGEYDDEELAAAIIHAEKMVRIARKKEKHLKAEENAENGMNMPNVLEESAAEDDLWSKEQSGTEDFLTEDPERNREKIEQQLARMEQMMEEAMRAAEELDGMDELSEELLETETDIEPADLEQRRKKHRMDEQREILEADMKYLKALFDKYAREKQNASSGVKGAERSDSEGAAGGASLEMAGDMTPVSGAEISLPAEGGNFDVSV